MSAARDPLRPLPDLGETDWDFDFDGDMVGDWWAEPASTPIHDQLVMESLLAATPRPPLWTRTPDWAIGLAVVALVLATVAGVLL